jgi:hypothetical protein
VRCGGDSACRRLPARVDWQADWQAGGSAGVFPVRAPQSLQQTRGDSGSDEYAAPGTVGRWHARRDSSPWRHIERAQTSPHGGPVFSMVPLVRVLCPHSDPLNVPSFAE